VALSSDGSSSEVMPVPAAYGPCSRKVTAAPTATATAPHTASRRSRSEAQPPGQHSSARTGTPSANARPAKPSHRDAGSAAATPASVGSTPPVPVDTSSPFPTAKE
jgi:hypothetical protein